MSESWKRVVRIIGKAAYVIIVFPAAFWALTFVFGVTGKTYCYARIGASEHNISVMGFSSFDTRYALIQLDDHGHLSNVILDHKELDYILAAWEVAKAHQSQRWIKISEFTESDVINPSRLTISAGQGVRFAIVDAGVCVRYDLSPQDFGAFDRATKRAKDHFVNSDADNGIEGANGNWRKAIDSTNAAFKESIPRGTAWPDCR